jgi:hypothetical protein
MKTPVLAKTKFSAVELPHKGKNCGVAGESKYLPESP